MSSTAGPARVSAAPMWILGLVIMIDQVDQNIVRGVVPQLKAAFHVGDLGIGVLMSAFVVVNGFVTVPAGYLADRWRRGRTIGHTIIGWSGITALTAASPNFGVMVAVRSLLGFGQGLTEPSAGSLLADLYPMEQRGRAFSVQQCLIFVGFALGVGLGGAVATHLGWRYAFLLVGAPGVVIAAACYRLREPRRGYSDRLHAGVAEEASAPDPANDLLADGWPAFLRDMVSGLRADLRTIVSIPTMRMALVGVGSLLFSVTAVASWLPEFYERQLHVGQSQANLCFGLLAVLGGVPGIILGGRVADRFNQRVRGARMAIPAYCILGGNVLFVASYLHLPFYPAWALEVIGFFVMVMSIPALRAGLSDALPAHLRGAGFGAFNLVSVLFGTAAAPFVVSMFSQLFGGNLRTAFLIVTPPVFVGGVFLLRARDHLDEDAGRIFQAIVAAAQAEQERQAARAAMTAAAPAGTGPLVAPPLSGTLVSDGAALDGAGRDGAGPDGSGGGDRNADAERDARAVELVDVALEHHRDRR